MKENRMVKAVLEGHHGGRRKIGRPRKRWLDDIEENLKTDESEEMEKESNRERSLG
jgi:hypothetical protein